MGNRRLEQVKGFRMPSRYRAVALTIWPGLAQIWSGQEALGLLLGGLFRVGAQSRDRVTVDLERSLCAGVG